jgi:hypothetical protein
MKVYVRHADGELMFPSFKDFQNMYRLKFVAPDDLVRRENSNRWVKASDLPELRAMHLYDRSGRERAVSVAMWLMLGAFAIVILIQLILAGKMHP